MSTTTKAYEPLICSSVSTARVYQQYGYPLHNLVRAQVGTNCLRTARAQSLEGGHSPGPILLYAKP